MLIFFLKKICDLFRQSHKNGFFSEFIFAIDFSQKKTEESIVAIGSYL